MQASICVLYSEDTDLIEGILVTERNKGAQNKARVPNASNRYEVTRAHLPLHCPMEDMSLWNSHPRVYLPIEETGTTKCPYCGADYFLVD